MHEIDDNKKSTHNHMITTASTTLNQTMSREENLKTTVVKLSLAKGQDESIFERP